MISKYQSIGERMKKIEKETDETLINTTNRTTNKIRYKIMREMINSCEFKDIIVDLGCGRYPISDGISSKKRYLIDEVYGYDLEKEIQVDDNTADIVIAGEVIEHIKNSKLLISEIKRVLKPGGYLILSTPNACSIISRIKMIFGKLPTHYEESPKHLHVFNLKKLLYWLKDFELIQSKSNGIITHQKLLLPAWFTPTTFGDDLIVHLRLKNK